MAKTKYKFVAPLGSGTGDVKMVSCRVPAALHELFDDQKKKAQAYGLDISITEVIKTAMRDAIAEVDAIVTEMEAHKASREKAQKKAAATASAPSAKPAQDIAPQQAAFSASMPQHPGASRPTSATTGAPHPQHPAGRDPS